MIKDSVVKNTIYFSLFAQLITTIIPLDAFNYKLNKNDLVLLDILKLETAVQVVEACFYIWVIFALKDLKKMTPRRYIDWVITTPTMLISTIVFMEYLKVKEKKDDKDSDIETNESELENFVILDKNNENKLELKCNPSLPKKMKPDDKPRVELKKFIIDNKENVTKIVIYNALMLLFGYLGETEILNKTISVLVGFIFFFLSFNEIYMNYARYTVHGKQLFNFLLGVWSLYGFAAFANLKVKNAAYNILDVISKNFYGLFLYYYVTKVGIRN